MKLYVISSIVLLVGLGLFVYYHETVHVKINASYGIDSDVNWFDFRNWGSSTVAEAPCPTEQCESLHLQNEIFGYQIMVVMIIVGLLICYNTLAKEVENEEKSFKQRYQY